MDIRLSVYENERNNVFNESSRTFWMSMISYSLLSFGIHYMRASLSIFAVYLIQDNFMTPGDYGFLSNAAFIPALFVPAISGYFLDKHEILSKKIGFIAQLQVLPILCQCLFAYAISHQSFLLSVIALVGFGVGACSIVAAQRTLIIERFQGSETLATGCYISSAAVARMLGLVLTAPIVRLCGSYIISIYLATIGGFVSLLFTFIIMRYYAEQLNYPLSASPRTHINGIVISSASPRKVSVLFQNGNRTLPSPSATPSLMYTYQSINSNSSIYDRTHMAEPTTIVDEDIHVHAPTQQSFSYKDLISWIMMTSNRLRLAIQKFPRTFWIFALVHAIYITTFHSLANFLPHTLTTSFHQSIFAAGRIASLTSCVAIVFTPLAGMYVDRIGHHVPICIIASILSTIGYCALLAPSINPILPILVISTGQSLIPLITLTCVGVSLPSSSIGIGFGVLEVVDSIFHLTGNLLYGALYDWTGSYVYSMITIFAMSMAGVLLLVGVEYYQLLHPQAHNSEDQTIAYETLIIEE